MRVLTELGARLRASRQSQTVTIAVTGLARSGKTAFITSIIANLEAAARAGRAQRWLNGFDVAESGRLRSVRRPAGFTARHGRAFPYEEMLAALAADHPEWPARTEDIYEVAVDIGFVPARGPDRPDAPAARLRLVLVDYPGEWLADVPLVRLDYATWSRQALGRLAAAPWSDVAKPFQALIASRTWNEPDSDDIARRAAVAWQDVLIAARDRGLKWIQPGQFVRMRGQSEGSAAPVLRDPALWFCPLPARAIDNVGRGTLAHRMNERFQGYQQDVRIFFSQTLEDATRHVLLVDVLEALAEGQHAFNETAQVLAEVYGVLADRNPGWFRALFAGRSHFEKVLLVATKADTVPPNQRAALSTLLQIMCAGVVANRANIRRPDATHVAAVRATEDVMGRVDGQEVKVVEGLSIELGKRVRVTMIDIPDTMPDSAYFKRREGVRTPRFVPPRVEHGGTMGVPNVRLGMLLNDLLGDILR